MFTSCALGNEFEEQKPVNVLETLFKPYLFFVAMNYRVAEYVLIVI